MFSDYVYSGTSTGTGYIWATLCVGKRGFVVCKCEGVDDIVTCSGQEELEEGWTWGQQASRWILGVLATSQSELI